MAKGSWNSWELPDLPVAAQGDGSRKEAAERQPTAGLVSVCATVAACTFMLSCTGVWVCMAFAEAPGLYATKGGLVFWPGLAGRHRA